MSRRCFINLSKYIFVLLLIVTATPSLAEEALVITSESLRADQGVNSVVFEGLVVARGGNMVLSAERMTALYGRDGSLKTLIAKGSVKFVKGLQILTSQRAVYDVSFRSMVFTGGPRAVDEGNVMLGESISYFLDEDRIKVDRSTVFIDDREARPVGPSE